MHAYILLDHDRISMEHGSRLFMPNPDRKMRTLAIGLVGDYDPAVPGHCAIPIALRTAADVVVVGVSPTWLPTDEIDSSSSVSGFDPLWCVPASPYHSMEGALRAIRHAREALVPFLGTCGGCRH